MFHLEKGKLVIWAGCSLFQTLLLKGLNDKYCPIAIFARKYQKNADYLPIDLAILTRDSFE
jgi:hypothetical protein